MTPPKIQTFFYGSYINPEVLAGVGLHPDSFEVVRLSGFDITIGPLANLVRSDRHSVYGVLIELTHAELRELYDHAEQVLGAVYLPEPVLCETMDGGFVPALVYLSNDLRAAPASADYVERIAGSAREFGFPAWYVERIEAFAPDADAG